MNADGIVGVDSRTYTTTEVSSKFNGIGAARLIQSKTKNHEEWSGTPVIFNTANIHEPLDIKSYLPEYEDYENLKSWSKITKFIFLGIPFAFLFLLIIGSMMK